MRAVAVPVIAATLVVAPTARAADVSWVLELPLTQGQAAVAAFVQSHGGTISGGAFSPQGWTTTSRGDYLELPLPPAIDGDRGVLELTFQDPELSGPTGYFESFILLTVDDSGAPFAPTPAGGAGLQSVYVAWNELDQPLKKLKGYFNLLDPSCTAWQLCTGEAGSGNGWLGDGSGTYSIVHSWAGAVDQIHMSGGSGNVNKTVDLSASSPTGVIGGTQLVLAVNPCGGSSHNACGQWDGPVHGGPLGITYVSVRLELLADCGDGTCSLPIEDCQSCAADCCGGAGGSGGQGGGGTATGGAGLDQGGAGGSGTGTAGSAGDDGSSGSVASGSPSASSDEGGCQLGARPDGPWATLAWAALGALLWRRRRRTTTRGDSGD